MLNHRTEIKIKLFGERGFSNAMSIPTLTPTRKRTGLQSCPPTFCWGTFTRKERWGLSWRGWLLASLVLAIAGAFLLLTVYPFLAVTHRVDANLLVVEGWIHEYAIRCGAEEFKAGGYERIFTTGGPLTGSGSYNSDHDTTAYVGAWNLKAIGIPSDRIQMVPAHLVERDRTYTSAVALRDWLRQRNIQVRSLNIVTENTHARRTWLLFQKAFGNTVSIGVIAARNPDYDPKRWWLDSEGVKDVVSESVAYLYARIFFHPFESK